MDPLNSSEFESLELLLEAPEVPDDELAVAGGGGELVGPVLVAGHDLDGADLGVWMDPLNIGVSCCAE